MKKFLPYLPTIAVIMALAVSALWVANQPPAVIVEPSAARNHYRLVTLTVAGDAGGAATLRNVNAQVEAVYLDFTSSDTTTDVTVGTKNAPVYNFVSETNYYTDTWYYPVVQRTDNGGSAVSGEYMPYIVAGDVITLTVSQASVTSTITAYIYLFEPGD